MEGEELKDKIREKAYDLGINLVSSCSVTKWEEIPIQDPEFWPQNIWPWVKNVIVLGIPLYSPMMSTTPSMVYQELYDTSNRVLDDMAYRLTNYIVNRLGYKAIFFPRDCYYNIDVLVDNPNAAFSHVMAGYYAGMGTIGDSHNHKGIRPKTSYRFHSHRCAHPGRSHAGERSLHPLQKMPEKLPVPLFHRKRERRLPDG